MPPAGFEPTIPAGERPQNHALHGAATGIGEMQLQDSRLRVLDAQLQHSSCPAG
jgi:hypothetical protein